MNTHPLIAVALRRAVVIVVVIALSTITNQSIEDWIRPSEGLAWNNTEDYGSDARDSKT